MKTLLVGDIHPHARTLLEQNTSFRFNTTEQFLITPLFPDVEAIVLRTFTPLKETELAKLPHLKYVVICSVGTDNLQLELLAQRNIVLIHCPGTNANSVAEHTVYLLLSLLREDFQKPYAELKGKTIGILGFGAIGKLVARKVRGFDVRVVAFDVIEQDRNLLKELQVEMTELNRVLEQADILTVHVPLNKHTEKMITAAHFRMMKDRSFFINTSRAEVIDEDALYQEYVRGKFRGIALDVCSSPLKEMMTRGNVIITDHCAAQGEDSFREQCVKPVEEFLRRIQR
ncbi:hypothetical protein HY496_03735 [Candidatus Woesearchaeota archaeon]|nr:hypothetical protein [Candidatus Woesearchaeota archaeon]